MNINPIDERQRFADELSSFDTKLRASANDVELLAELKVSMSGFLASSVGNETEIRVLLAERMQSGALRKETVQLASSVLSQLVTESVPTSPTDWRTTAKEQDLLTAPNDDFGTTTVIPVGSSPVDAKPGNLSVQVGSVLRDRFVLQQKVSGGSMGVVYKALDRRLAESGSSEQWVAIKVLSPSLAENAEALRALQQEAAKGRSLVHPNIVRFVDLDRDDDLYFIVMEWMPGKTLAEILDSDERTRIDRDTAIDIFRQIGGALDYAHKRGIVHADVKPGNVMILDDGTAKLFDFGVARVKQHSDQPFDPAVLGALTPAYSSMQVLTGEDPVAADDVFSLACLLYRLVAGYRVFGPRNAAEAAEEGMEPQRPQGIGAGQWRTVRKALSYPRITRYESVHEFLDSFESVSDETISFEIPERIIEDNPPASHAWVWLLLIALASAAIGYREGYLDRWLPTSDAVAVEVEEPVQAADQIIELPPFQEIEEVPDESVVVDEPRVMPRRSLSEPEVGPASNIVDFSTLPAASMEVAIRRGNSTQPQVDVVVREDGAPVIIDFVRDGNLTRSLNLRFDEVGFSGNRSPWAAGQYAYSNSGQIQFPPGQARGRIELTMASDPVREADQVSTLRLRDVESAESVYAILNISLEDDDQRQFESQLAPNTIAFAASQASIRETDPAVQIDLVRFNPDDSTIVAQFNVIDITATEGEDYFAPGGSTVRFGPGQRAARLLIPLVQDALVEGDEAFIIQLTGLSGVVPTGVYQRIAVMIRDDEPQAR